MPEMVDTPIQRETTDDGEALYRLPRRPRARRIGLTVVLLSLLGVVFTVAFSFFTLYSLVNATTPGGTTGWALGLITVVTSAPVATTSAFVGYAGLLALFGHTTIRVGPRDLTATDRLGPFRHQRPIAVDQVRRFIVLIDDPSTTGKPAPLREHFALLHAEAGDPRPAHSLSGRAVMGYGLFGRGVVAWGYPRHVLRRLADELTRELNSVGSRGQPIGVVEIEGGREPKRDERGEAYVPPRPHKATAIATPLNPGVSIALPARGLFAASRGQLAFALVWLVCTTLVGQAAIQSTPGARPGFLSYAFVVTAWVIGIGVLLHAIHFGRRRGVIDAVAGRLVVTQRSIFGARQNEWLAEEIATIAINASEKQDQQHKGGLQVRLAWDKPVKLFPEREPDEARWLAALLRRELALDQPLSSTERPSV
ncbi:MAG: hypothetical protein AAF797_16515 [Planctomycetota bacterium]